MGGWVKYRLYNYSNIETLDLIFCLENNSSRVGNHCMIAICCRQTVIRVLKGNTIGPGDKGFRALKIGKENRFRNHKPPEHKFHI